MTVITVGSVRGAPGVTTFALLLAGGIEQAVLVEADPAGSVLAIRYGLGREPGLTTLAASKPEAAEGWRSHVQFAGGVPVVVGPDSPVSSEALWRGAGARLRSILRQIDAPAVVVDAGRLGSESSALLAASDLVLVLARPTAEHLVTLTHRIAFFRGTCDSARFGILLVGDGPYRTEHLGPSLGADVIGTLPDDPRAGSMLVKGGRSRASFGRTRLARAAAGLSVDVTRMAGEPATPTGAAG